MNPGTGSNYAQLRAEAWSWRITLLSRIFKLPSAPPCFQFLKALTEHDSILYQEAFMTQPRAVKLTVFLGGKLLIVAVSHELPIRATRQRGFHPLGLRNFTITLKRKYA